MSFIFRHACVLMWECFCHIFPPNTWTQMVAHKRASQFCAAMCLKDADSIKCDPLNRKLYRNPTNKHPRPTYKMDCFPKCKSPRVHTEFRTWTLAPPGERGFPVFLTALLLTDGCRHRCLSLSSRLLLYSEDCGGEAAGRRITDE